MASFTARSDYRVTDARTASRMMSTTTSGAVTIGVWSTGAIARVAPIRVAMKRWVSAAIIRSSSATRNQLGRSRHSGRPTAG